MQNRRERGRGPDGDGMGVEGLDQLCDRLKSLKDTGKELSLKDLSVGELRQLWWDEMQPDAVIADLYTVPTSAVTRLRRKRGIDQKRMLLESFLADPRRNAESLATLKDPQMLPEIAKAAAHIVFRNGPVEDMHAAGKLSENDMMILNKFCANRFAYLLQLLMEEHWTELGMLLGHTSMVFGHDWDDPQPDDDGWRDTLLMLLRRNPQRP